MQKHMYKNIKWLYISLIFVTIASCHSDRLNIDTDEINVKPTIYRFEKEIFSADINHYESSLQSVYTRDSLFFNLYVDRVLNYQMMNGNYNRFDSLKNFVTHPLIKKLYHEVEKQYTDIKDIDEELTGALKHFKYHFPTAKIPSVTTIIDEVGSKVRVFPNTIAISLDHFLGEDFDGYKVIPELNTYQIRRMRKEYIVTTIMHGLYYYTFEEKASHKTFLAAMIEEGKIQYFIDAMLPELSDTIKREYTKKQLDFCDKNQADMWNHFAQRKLFFNGNESDYERFMIDGPFTISPDVPASSAPRLGMYCGWQIVKHYMNEHPEVSLISLMNDRDYPKILRESKYRPN